MRNRIRDRVKPTYFASLALVTLGILYLVS